MFPLAINVGVVTVPVKVGEAILAFKSIAVFWVVCSAVIADKELVVVPLTARIARTALEECLALSLT